MGSRAKTTNRAIPNWHAGRTRATHAQCPRCAGRNIVVIDSRVESEGLVIRRRRACGDCSLRWSTREVIENDLAGIRASPASNENPAK